MNKNLHIVQPSLIDILSLPGLFRKAVHEEYKVYDRETRRRIVERHSLIHLLIARYKPGRTMLLALHDKTCVGVLLASHSSDGIGIINWIYVLPKYRKRNIAKKLLARVEKEFIKYNCHKLIVTTEVAQSFYRKIGYTQEAILKKHWWNKDFYLFYKSLKNK